MSRSVLVILVCAAAVAAIVSAHVRPGAAAPVTAIATAADGKTIFAARCAACHQANGSGNGPYPPLAGNADVLTAETATLIATVLNGRTGPIQVSGKTYSGTMPAWKDQLSNDEIAAVLTYVRSAWSNGAAAVSADQVALLRKPTAPSGAQIFVARCAACHQSNGQGTSAYPPLDGNPHVAAGDPKEIIATIVNGRSGELVVNGKTYNGKMPTWKGQLSNADIAAVATFVRGAWSNRASGITERQVAGAGPSVSTAVGASIYASRCSACHGASGQGGGHGMFPSLAGDALATAGDPAQMLERISHGRSMMPAWKGQLSPGDIAAVATFVRSAWGNKAGPVSVEDVTAVK